MTKKIVIIASAILVAAVLVLLWFVTWYGIVDWTTPQLTAVSLTAAGQDDEQLATDLMTAYLEPYRSLLAPQRERLKDFTIHEIHSVSRSGDEFSFSVSYSVRPAGGSSNWIAGNGRTGDDGWIVNKFAFVTAKGQGDVYTLSNIGTGP